ncbi:MAG TPA: YihY/virulence factor BrkB family protein [Prolixibacteraceae bacterium]|nr:YihY/virulence factor BrkB family protein [Prolixibacteraceae bacterium]HPR85412.1 YihY/virulence factor BrkB family protein [Prolixibacteraceae bacterium]
MPEKISRKLISFWENVIRRAKQVTFPGLDGMPVYDVTVFFWKSIVDGAITTRASAIAFSFFVALFPAIIFLFTLIPYIPIANFQDELFLLIRDFVPENAFKAIEETVKDILTRQRGGLLSLGFFMALIFSTNGFASIMTAFDASLHSFERRTWLGQRVIAVLLLAIMSVLLTITIALITYGQSFINYLVFRDILKDHFTVYMLTFGKWIVILLLIFIANSFLYWLAPAKRTKWRFISAGGTLSTVLSIATFSGFSYYINHFGQYNKLYGSIGTLLVILLLMYIMSMILLVGFELNASISEAVKHSDKKISKR